MKRIYLVFSINLLLFNTVSLADENVAPELHIDPFINPLTTVPIEPEKGVENVSTGIAPTVGKAARTSFLFQPEIRGIILTHDGDELSAFVNVGGEMIELGGKYEGYRLIKVKGQSVVFEKNGKQYPVSLDPVLGDTDEDEGTL